MERDAAGRFTGRFPGGAATAAAAGGQSTGDGVACGRRGGAPLARWASERGRRSAGGRRSAAWRAGGVSGGECPPASTPTTDTSTGWC